MENRIKVIGQEIERELRIHCSRSSEKNDKGLALKIGVEIEGQVGELPGRWSGGA